MTNPSRILAMVPDGRTRGSRHIWLVLDEMPSNEWQSLFYRAFLAVSATNTEATYSNSNPERRVWPLIFTGAQATPGDGAYRVVQGWNADHRKYIHQPGSAILFDSDRAIMIVKDVDPTAEYALGTGGSNFGLIDILIQVVAAVGSTDPTAARYALSLHYYETETDMDFDTIQGKF